MKKLLFLVILAAAVTAYATDHNVKYTDDIAVADTIATALRVDTVYSDWFELRDLKHIGFWTGVYARSGDTNWTADTFFVYFQHAPYRTGNGLAATDHVNLAIDTFVQVGTSLSRAVLDLARTDSIFGNWGRFMWIHWDSTEADVPDLVGNEYGYWLKAYTATVK